MKPTKKQIDVFRDNQSHRYFGKSYKDLNEVEKENIDLRMDFLRLGYKQWNAQLVVKQ